jgi:CHAT domain-containing protein
MAQRNKQRPALELRRSQFGFRGLTTFLTPLLIFFLLAVTPSSKAHSRTGDLIRQSTQEPSDAGKEKDVQALETGKTIRRELAGGQQHSYQIRLIAGQFLKATIVQQGIDVVAQVSGPDGKQILEFDSESRLQEREEVSLVTEAAGNFMLIVRPKYIGAPAGSYEIRIEELRAATENDHSLQEANKLYKKAIDLRNAGKYNEALPLFERALEIREIRRGPDHPDVGQAINGLAVLYFNKGEYAKAEPLHQRALAIRVKSLGPEHPDVAGSLTNLANLYSNLGDYAKAEPLHQRALAIRVKSLGPEHPDVAASLHNIANVYWYQGEYTKAEPLYQRALAIREKLLGPEHPDVAHSLTTLALLYWKLGDYAKAEPLNHRALAIYEKSLGPDHPFVAGSLHNLAVIYWSLGDYTKAEPLERRALAIREKSFGPEHPNVAGSLNNLAMIYRGLGDHAKSEPLHQRVLAIREKSLGPDHPDVARSLHSLAVIYSDLGDYAKAESLHRRALAIYEKSLGPDHPEVAGSLNDLAVLHIAKNDMAQAIAFQSRANAVIERNLKLNLAIGSERQKLAHLATLSDQTDRTLSLHIRYAPRDPAARSLAATLILQRKGRALDAASESLNALRSRFNQEDRALLNKLTEARSRIARLILDGPQRMTAELHQARIKELEDQADKDEADISRRSDEFRVQYLPVTLEAVRAAIPPDSALIEFASYRPFNAKAIKGEEAYGQPRYVAYVLRREGEIEWKELGDAKAIDTSVTALRKASRDPKRVDVKRIARAVDAKVFQPLRPLLGDVDRLLISPDGSLNLISFAALVDERGRYAVERYSISYLTSGRDLLRLQAPRESIGGPLVVAAPDFGRRSQVEAAPLEEQEKDALEGEVKAESARSAIKEIYFPPLPNAEREGEALRELLPDATLLTKGQATKAALSQVRSPKLLHIATHSFFLGDQQLTSVGERGARALSDDPERALQLLEARGVRIDSPLLRSGLALAGVNEHKEDDNGILTALEVTGLNLWGTKLVTLSACDTGVGEVKNGDGVHGLRRALVLAGSETQVMSLWAVSDKATRELMVAYYGRLKQGQGRGEALRRVQLEMLKNVNRRHPYYWASFIQSGEWANLEGKR